MTSPQLTIYVACHAPGPHPSGPGPYTAVGNVRPDGTRPAGFEVYDDDGGLPDRNVAYCELSPTYRLQHRADTRWVGLVHYRRIFATRTSWRRGPDPGLYRIPRFDWAHPEAWGADEASLMAAVNGKDWCTAPPLDVRRRGFASLWEQFAAWHPQSWMESVDKAIATVSTAAPSFEEYLRSTTALRPFNMFLGSRDRLRDYGAFLWPVLDEFQRRVPDLPTSGYQARYAGFLAERLHGYWLDHLAPAGLRVGHLPVALLGPASATDGTVVASPRSVRAVLREQAQAVQSFAPPAVAGWTRRKRRAA